jgi:hypothetical protein
MPNQFEYWTFHSKVQTTKSFQPEIYMPIFFSASHLFESYEEYILCRFIVTFRMGRSVVLNKGHLPEPTLSHIVEHDPDILSTLCK